MIALFEKQCPQASREEGHYQALNAYADKRLDKCVFGEFLDFRSEKHKVF